MASIEVTRTYLEMRAPTELTPSAPPPDPPRLERIKKCTVSFFRYLYGEVGRAYHWNDRLSWSDQQVQIHLANPAVSLWLLTSGAVPAGYFELLGRDDRSIEIAYFGLLPEFVGRGWGGFLLARAVETAWEMKPDRVWLHTCTLDHPAALPNYIRRGFRPFREEVYTAELPTVSGQ